MEEKVCTLCKICKNVSEFTKKNKKPGSWCRQCYRNYFKEKGYSKYSYPGKAARDIVFQRKLRKTEKNKQYEKTFRKEYLKSFNGTMSKLLSSARKRAKDKQLEFDLDSEWLKPKLNLMKCEATGVDLMLEKRENVCHAPFRPSIDRIDNSRGYTKDNCRVVCVIFNKAKSDCLDEDVIKMAVSLVKLLKLQKRLDN